ncbi:hypothetical protein HYC85_010265 [Camellia sinensis]|uniref:Large ribosomal subunit protein mL45 n=1 Tax=Camellia sinensis TaxID=4442 RepID=A0A7J7HJB2_CAMSI|nr:hypothetical protein HYC85_010265 [Camellia sinensis]
MALGRLQKIRNLYGTFEVGKFSSLFGSSTSYSDVIVKVPEINYRSISSCLYKCNHGLPWTSTNTKALRSTMAAESYVSMGDIRLLKSAYAINKLRKSGYSKQKFYKEALNLYKEINTQISNGDKTSLRKTVTEKMYSGLKNEIKQRESMWSAVYWELIGVDQNDLNKTFIQLTLEFLTKQKFEAYDSKGAVVAGDKNKEVLVRDIWVFEKSMFHPGSYWRLCGRVKF